MPKKPATNNLPPGTKTPVSGQYERIGPRGGRTGAEVTSVKGNPLPPGKKGERFRLVDRTRHPKR